MLPYLGKAASFVKYRLSGVFDIEPTNDDVGNYTLVFFLTDVNPNPLQNQYSFGLIVQSVTGAAKPLVISPILNVTITEMSAYGDLNITFNEDVKPITSFAD